MVNDEHGRFVGRILHNVFLLGDTDKVARTLAVCNLFFDMVGREYALKMTNSVIATGVNAGRREPKGRTEARSGTNCQR
jgi:hypothetical protein